MAVTLSVRQLPALLKSLQMKQKVIQTKIQGDIKSTLNSVITDYDFIVDSWPDYKAVVVRYSPTAVKFNGYLATLVSCFTTDNAALKTLLQEPAIMDWSKKLEIYCFHRDTLALVKSISQLKGSYTEDRCFHMTLTMDTLKLSAIPDGFKMTNLQPNQADIVNSVWKYNMGEHTETYIRDMVSKLPSCCLYNKEEDVVGFAAMYHYGDIGMLHVPQEHRRKGYAKLIVSHLAHSCLKKDIEVSALVDIMNVASINLRHSVGFETVSETFVLYVNR